MTVSKKTAEYVHNVALETQRSMVHKLVSNGTDATNVD